jgi:hypothetical protein
MHTSLSKVYVIQYDPDTNTVTVEPAARISQGYENLIQEEQGHERRDTVFVEIDRAEDLKQAYPNYFLDVGVFNYLLLAAMNNRSAAEMREVLSPLFPKQQSPELRRRYRAIWRFGRWAGISMRSSGRCGASRSGARRGCSLAPTAVASAPRRCSR